MGPAVKFGTRGSALALWQTHYVMSCLKDHNIGLETSHEIYSTKGDRVIDVPLPQVGGKGLFTAELESALHSGGIDCAVHSLKDLPTDQPDGLTLGAIMPREDAHDVLISRAGLCLAELPKGATIGTSSLRRGTQLLRVRPDIKLLDIRGNVDTRIKKALDTAGPYDAILLAAAGVNRLGFTSVVTETLHADIVVPAPGQGAVAVQMRSDWDGCSYFSSINCIDTLLCVTAERAFLRALGGGCSVPIGAYATIQNHILTITTRVCAPDASAAITTTLSIPTLSIESAYQLGCDIASLAIEQGASRLLTH